MHQTISRKFTDRRSAGRELAARLEHLAGENPVVIGLARGGVPVAHEVAQRLEAPLDVLVVRKIGSPGNPELAIGAVAEGGVRVVNAEIVRELLVSEQEMAVATQRAETEVRDRVQRYRGPLAPIPLTGRTVVVVDDGLATGATARAAVRAVRSQRPRRVILAVPVGSPETVAALASEADEVTCLVEPEAMWAVGYWYDRFEPTTDREVSDLLRRPAGGAGEADDPPAAAAPTSREVWIPDAGIVGDLVLPERATGLVVFAHGSGSSRFSPRNRRVASLLNERGFGTLLLDLLTPAEERERANVFDVELLSGRLVQTTRWVREQPELEPLPIGYFGASTGAAAALGAAAELKQAVSAVVSRGGRPDLAARALPAVQVPVLLIVGGHDPLVLELNREALLMLHARSHLAIVPGATHLFEEAGALDEVTRLSGDWFERWLSPNPAVGA